MKFFSCNFLVKITMYQVEHRPTGIMVKLLSWYSDFISSKILEVVTSCQMSSNYKGKQNTLILAGTGQASKQSRACSLGQWFLCRDSRSEKTTYQNICSSQSQRRFSAKHGMGISSRKHIKVINNMGEWKENIKLYTHTHTHTPLISFLGLTDRNTPLDLVELTVLFCLSICINDEGYTVQFEEKCIKVHQVAAQ